MSSVYIPKALRRRVAEQAGYRCGYCLTSEAITGQPMEMEHIFPSSLGRLRRPSVVVVGQAPPYGDIAGWMVIADSTLPGAGYVRPDDGAGYGMDA